MKIHYFQRYHEKENVATANTMLLLSRLYAYSSDKFFKLLKYKLFSDSFEPEIIFDLQPKSKTSIPDSIITQDSFKIVVETKTSNNFNEDQLLRHLKSFRDEKYKVILSLASIPMTENTKLSFESKLEKYNNKQIHPVRHINTTFEEIANAIDELLDDRDYEMQDVLEDYLDYCCRDGLITVSNANKYMRMQPTGNSLDFDVKNNIYIVRANREFKPHRYLGLYKDKSIRAVGKVIARITAVKVESGVEYSTDFGSLTDDRKAMIEHFFAENHLENDKHRFFFVEKFYETDFRKTSKGGAQGSKIFDLTEVLGRDNIPDTETLAKELSNKTWT